MNELNRRRFLQGSIAAAAALHATPTRAADPAPPRVSGIIDTNVYLDRWPFRRLRLDDTAALVEKLRAQGVAEAWAGSFDGLLHEDIGAVNARLAQQCQERGGGLLKPFGSINLSLPNWEEDLRRCHEVHRMSGVRLHPNYQNYKLDDPAFPALLKEAAARKLIVQIVGGMEDERTQHSLLRVSPVDLTPLPRALEAAPDARVMLLNWPRMSGGKPVLMTLQVTSVLFDIALLEGIAGIETVLEDLPVERLCFGSYAPYFYHEAATLKLKESELSAAQIKAITHENAAKFLSA